MFDVQNTQLDAEPIMRRRTSERVNVLETSVDLSSLALDTSSVSMHQVSVLLDAGGSPISVLYLLMQTFLWVICFVGSR